MTPQFAPVALFAYRRTTHLAAVLDSLERCPEFSASPVYVFSDGPRDAAAAADVDAVRAMLAARKRPNMTILEAPRNRGLANSIIAGVSELCDRYGRVIVIEDDLVVSPALLTWFNAALDRYQDTDNVWQVSGFQFPIPAFSDRGGSMFLRISSSWGWATWKRAWQNFDREAPGWSRLQSDARLAFQFDLNGAYPYTKMLLHQMSGKVDSWAVRFWWTVFCQNGLTLFPARSLVANIGDDDTATHTTSRLIRAVSRQKKCFIMPSVPSFPAETILDADAQKKLEKFLRRGTAISDLLRRLYSPVRSLKGLL